MKKVTMRKIRSKRVRLSPEARAEREAENKRRMQIEARALDIESRRIDKAKADAVAVLDRRSSSWGAKGEAWQTSREEEAQAARMAAKERRRRRKLELPNDRVNPVHAQTFNGERVMVDSISGRFNLMVNRYGWPRELGEACQRFEHDYQLSMGGIRAASLEPHVDGGRSPQNTAQIEALQRVQRIEAMIDPEDWMVFILWTGHGITITEMHKRGFGVKDELGRRLRKAANRAAAFYHSGFVGTHSASYLAMRAFHAELTKA